MNDSESILVGFVSGLVDYKKFQETITSGKFSDELLQDIPLSIIDDFMVMDTPNVFEYLETSKNLREWTENNVTLTSQLSKAKRSAFDCVKSKIHTAFDDAKLGNGVTLRQGHAADNYLSDEEQLLEREKDKNFTWQNYPVDDLEGLTSLLHIDGEGFAFYIPAYLCWCMDNCLNDPYSDIASNTFVSLDPDISDLEIRLSAFNSSQKKAVIDFLWLFAIYSDVFRESCILSLSKIDKTDFLTKKIECSV